VITGDAIACMAREPIVGAFASIPPRRPKAFGASRNTAMRFRARPELRPLVLVGSDAEEVDVEFSTIFRLRQGIGDDSTKQH